MRRTVDHDEFGAASPVLDPLRRPPAWESGKVETDVFRTKPGASQLDPGGEARLRVDVEQGDPPALSQPRRCELGGESCLSGAALALRYRNYQPRHRLALTEADGRITLLCKRIEG